VLAGAVLAFARALGEFGATIVLAGNVEGETRTIPVAVYTLLNVRDGEAAALRLVAVSVALALAALLGSFWLSARERRAAGRG
jgi:molybdate transport system permease protein